MSLRSKCLLLLIAFELTLAATLLFTVRYIGVYFDDAANLFSISNRAGVDLGRLRGLVRAELMLLQRGGDVESLRGEFARLDRDVQSVFQILKSNYVPPLEALEMEEFENLLRARADSAGRFLASQKTQTTATAFNPDAHLAVDARLGGLEAGVNDKLRSAVETSFLAQKQAALLLSVNMLVAAAIGIVGMMLVRRWVLIPIQELTRATDEIGKGRLDHRANVPARDELGRLADALNKMSADLAGIEKQMVLRERAAATGELISYVAHNIRNPLAGIRSLVDSCLRQTDADSPIRASQGEIVAAIERMQRWLREMEHTCKPLEIEARAVDVRHIIDNIIAVFKPMADRRGVRLNREDATAPASVMVDERHFEQAVAAIVGNAIEAMPEGGEVTIGVEQSGVPAQWSLYVADSGEGVPEELRQRIFDPAFSTKREGRGTGLATARRVAELHGGRLTVESPQGGGAVFRFSMNGES